MTKEKSTDITSVRSFLTFTSHFFNYCYVLRGLLGAQYGLIVLGGVMFAHFEDIAISQGIYFALITAHTVGYGDIVPATGIGQVISVVLALIGTILFGLMVAVATQAFTVTIKEYLQVHGDSQSS